MAINDASFKIYVGSFTDKNVLASGNALTIYQIGSIQYTPTKILDSIEVINEFYEEGDREAACTTSLFGCTESLTTTVDPCPGGGGTGAQGPPGANGANGANGRSTIISVTAEQLDCNASPTATITDPSNNQDGTQTQILTLGIPSSCGGDGGSVGVKVTSTGGSVFSVPSATAIDFKSSGNMALGAAFQGSTQTSINIKATCTAVGYFKILSVRRENGRFRYRGCPQKFMSIGANNTDPNTSEAVDLNFVDDVDAIEVVNVAEDNFSTPIPLGVDIGAEYQDIPSALIYPVQGAPGFGGTSVSLSAPLTVVLYKDTSNMFQDGTVGEIGQNGGNINKVWFINTKNPLNGTLLKGKISQVELFDGQNSGPKWRYKLNFCSIDSNILAATGPTVNLSVFKSKPQVWAYNQHEIGNTSGSGYGYPVTFSSGTFSLTSSPGFTFNHVPLNQIVDIGVDESGSFYFKAPNTITGACV